MSPAICHLPSAPEDAEMVAFSELGGQEDCITFGTPFRGGIVENCARFKFVGSGYDGMPKDQEGQFRIDSARQCAGPMAALTDDAVRITHVIGATQVLKSMDGDAWVVWSVEHERKSFLILFEDDPKAERVREIVNAIGGGVTGQAEIIQRTAYLLSVVGECFHANASPLLPKCSCSCSTICTSAPY